MINIDNIFNAPVLTDPWEHLIIDNILTEDAYNKIKEESLKLSKHLYNEPRDSNGIWMYKAKEYGISQEVIDLIMDINYEILKVAPQLMGRFEKKLVSQAGYFSIPRFNYVKPGEVSAIHDDGSNDKTMIMIIYLYPNKSYGTRLYKTEQEESFVREVEWKTNRAFILPCMTDVSWHSFRSNDDERISINFYYERLEDMAYINTLPIEKVEWFYDNFAQDKISIELDKND